MAITLEFVVAGPINFFHLDELMATNSNGKESVASLSSDIAHAGSWKCPERCWLVNNARWFSLHVTCVTAHFFVSSKTQKIRSDLFRFFLQVFWAAIYKLPYKYGGNLKLSFVVCGLYNTNANTRAQNCRRGLGGLTSWFTDSIEKSVPEDWKYCQNGLRRVERMQSLSHMMTVLATIFIFVSAFSVFEYYFGIWILPLPGYAISSRGIGACVI